MRTPRLGIAICTLLAVCAVVVFVRGVRWDETFEHAQVLTGQVAYPEGHPLPGYLRGAFSVQTFASAALLQLGAGPALLCGLRNALFLAAAILPAFLLAHLLTSSMLAGCAAALLLMQGIFLEFDGSYPNIVWPDLYSNGPIGGGAALLTLYALLAGKHRSAGLLVGLLPAIHIGQFPPVLGVFLLAPVWGWARRNAMVTMEPDEEGEPSSQRQAARGYARRPVRGWKLVCGFAVIGLLLSAGVWLVQRSLDEPMPAAGPFAVQGDALPIWQGYTFEHDPHRRFPPGNGQVLLIGTLLIAGLALLRAHREGAHEPALRVHAGLLLYVAGVAAATWGIMLVQALLGTETPFVLVAWMPYRLINQLPPICLALLVSALLSRGSGRPLIGGALLFGALHPLWAGMLPHELYTRYLAHGDAVAFALYGAGLWVLLAAYRPRTRVWRPTAVIALAIALGAYHQAGALCVLAGSIFARMLRGRGGAAEPAPIFASILVIALAGMLLHQFQHRAWLPRGAFEARIADHVREHAPEAGMLVTEPYSFQVQARTGLPVFAEAATPSLISYVPALGPVIDRMYRDVYGITFARGAGEGAPWREVWRAREAGQWRELGARYGFRFVAAPADVALRLEPVLTDAAGVLYRIPE